MNYQATRRHGETLNALLLSERHQYEKTIYDPNYMTFWKMQNYRDSKKKKISDCPGLGDREGWITGA